MDKPAQLVHRLLGAAGTTSAVAAGIGLKNTPMPLFQLLMLCMLASKPIDAAIAESAAHELFHSGLRTPQKVLTADSDAIISALGRAHYVRYDESSATRLVDMAHRAHADYHGDLRALADRSDHDTSRAIRLLKRFNGIGDTGARIYLREVQDTWTWVRPYFDDRVLSAAGLVGLPTSADRLGELAPHHNARLAAALIRVSHDEALRARVLG